MARVLPFNSGYPGIPAVPLTVDEREPIPTLRPGDEPSLRQQLLPLTIVAFQYGNIQLMRRDSPVLRTMGLTQDERVWRAMRRTEPRIASSILGLNTLMMSYGWAIAPDPERKGRRAAKTLAEFANAAVRGIHNLSAAVEKFVLPQYDGWMPYQLLWATDVVRFRGRQIWSVTNVLAQHQEHFFFTPEWTLVYRDPSNWSAAPLVFSEPRDRIGWLVGRYGSTASPYGEADLEVVWLAHHIKGKFLEWYQRAARGSANGIPKFVDKTPAPIAPIAGEISGGDGKRAMQAILQEAQDLLRVYEKTGVMVCRGGVDLELLTNVAGMSGWREALDYLDQQIQVYVEGQHLTSEVRQSGGSRALGDTHQQTKIAFARRNALMAESVFDSLLRTLCQQNFGEVDPEDLPHFRLGLHEIVEVDKAQAAYAMGGRLDGAAIAEKWHIPLADLDADPATVWQQKAAPAPVSATAAPPTESGGAVGEMGREAAPEPVDTAEPDGRSGLG